ncbi:ABC transporter ATP-binding protein [Paenibacillus sp. NPDC056579]|uniref:ABC transporter ATP-binding protein n=1 Tax=Paenibacillus sp. NPDC056579 TaxID=3345871 RepID=UPI0036C09713
MGKAKLWLLITTIKRASVRRIFALFIPYRHLTIFIIIVALVSSIMSLIPPILLKSIIDTAIPDRNINLLLLMGGGVLVVTLLSGGLDVVQNHLENIVGQRIMRDLRMNIYSNLLRQPMSFFTQSRSGEIIQRLTSDIQMVQTVVTRSVVTAITQSVIWFTSVVILMVMDHHLALIALLTLPLYILPTRKAAQLRKRVLSESQQARSDMLSHIAETTGISGALLTRIYSREHYHVDKFSTLNDQVMNDDLRINLIGKWVSMFNGALPSIGTILIYVYGGYNVMQGTMSIGAIIAFSIYLSKLYNPTQQLLNLQMDMITSLATFERIFEYQDLCLEKNVTVVPSTNLPFIKGKIKFNNVSFQYVPEQPSLSNITFEVHPGQFIAIVGPSGAGKSTLIGMIARLNDPASGYIQIDGYNICDVSIDSLRQQIAFVTQESYLFHASIRENVEFAKINATVKEIEEACKQANINDYIQSLPQGYNTIVGERGFRLSGGERQRLSIARAILKKPQILLLDEATSHLDSHSELHVQAALENLMKECTTVVVAHRLSTILRADKIIVLEKGKVVEVGTHKELLNKKGLYLKLYQAQFSQSMLNAE